MDAKRISHASTLEQRINARDRTGANLMRQSPRLSSNSLSHIDGKMDKVTAHDDLPQMVADKSQKLHEEHQLMQAALKELQDNQGKLLHAQKLESIGQLAAGIAHEINTPTQYVSDNLLFLQGCVTTLLTTLDSALAMLELGRNQALPAEKMAAFDEHLRKIKLDFMRKQMPPALEQSIDGLSRVANIVRALKDFSHPSMNRMEMSNINEAIESTSLVARNEWRYVADLELELEPGMPLIPCLRDQFCQVILNLIVNAAHAIEDQNKKSGRGKGKITVLTRAHEEFIEIQVRDDGAGIPLEIRERIFEPFFTTKVVGKGTGQGLAIAHMVIVERHQGTLTLKSEVDVGTTFSICLPLTAAHDDNGDGE